MPLHEVQSAGRSKFILENECRPRQEGPEDSRSQSEHVEQGHNAHNAIIRAQPQGVRRTPRYLQEIGVRQLDAFGLPGGAGGVYDGEKFIRRRR